MEEKHENFSYSKLNTFENCGWSYKLQYVDKHFFHSDSVATDFGTLIHFVEETIAKDIVANDNEPLFMLDDNKYIDIFINGAMDGNKKILGIKEIRTKYPDAFYEKDKHNMNYEDKANDYLNNGIYRLREYLASNRNLHIVGIEQPFNVDYRGYNFKGFIDRVLQDVNTGEIFIEDIKTWPAIKGHDVVTPLQFVFYTLAAQELYNVEDPTLTISCAYDLPLAKERYAAGTKGYMKRGLKKINHLLDLIEQEEFVPNPSPLCHWCVFSKTYPDQPEGAKGLCPYYMNWTREKRDFSKDFEWMGMENHDAIIKEFLKRLNEDPATVNVKVDTDYKLPFSTESPKDNKEKRIFFIRR